MKINKAIIMVIFAAALVSAYIFTAAHTNASGTLGISADSAITDSIKVTFTCPMHPEVTSDQPGTCPKCGMDLVPKKSDVKEEGMNSCPDMEKCKEKGCDMNDCKGQAGGCMNDCPMMKDHNDHEKSKEHNHDSKDKDDGNGHKHKSGCNKKGC